ncbi:hypothetical protein EDD85DRAFT_792118 [Armillaria nabsnona]|nr:hypothetical protein EDD85DRAFT_792118 [Armillaria nabsnona]
MLAPIEYCDSATPKPYELALTPTDLSVEDYEVLTEEWTTMEEMYEEAAREAKEVYAEKLRQDKEACAAKVELLKHQKLEAEQKEEKKKEKEKEDEANELALQAAGAPPVICLVSGYL